jgi:hypothetical protein
VKPLDESAALERVREAGLVESISALAAMLNWERTRAQRVLTRWEAAGFITLEPGHGGRKIIRVTITVEAGPDAHPPDAQPSAHDAHPAHPVAHPAQLATWWWRVVGRRAHPVAHPAHPPAGRSLVSILVAAVLFLAAGDLGGSGLVMNALYASSLGSGEGATIQAAIGIAIDAIALVLLSAGYLLLNHGHRRLAVLAWIVWPVMLGLSLMNTIGFSATTSATPLQSARRQWPRHRRQ